MNNDFSIYAKKLAQLKKELSDMQSTLRSKKKSFNENQQKVYDFVIGKREVIQFSINEKLFFIKKGNEHKGFMHILLRHYGEDCEGKITATNILNIATTIKMGSSFQSEKNDYMSISNEFNKIRYIVVVSKDKNGHWVVTYYSVEE